MYSVGDLVMMSLTTHISGSIVGAIVNIDPEKTKFEVEWFMDHDKLHEHSTYIHNGKAVYQEKHIKTFRELYFTYKRFELNR